MTKQTRKPNAIGPNADTGRLVRAEPQGFRTRAQNHPPVESTLVVGSAVYTGRWLNQPA